MILVGIQRFFISLGHFVDGCKCLANIPGSVDKKDTIGVSSLFKVELKGMRVGPVDSNNWDRVSNDIIRTSIMMDRNLIEVINCIHLASLPTEQEWLSSQERADLSVYNWNVLCSRYCWNLVMTKTTAGHLSSIVE